MKARVAFLLVYFSLSVVFATDNACSYASSNIGFVKTQTLKAIEAEDLNQTRYFAYKALNAIEKSKDQLKECGCEYAYKNILAGLDNLKKATRVSSLQGTRILLRRALENTMGSLDALEQHDELHKSPYASDVLAMNTKTARDMRLLRKPSIHAAPRHRKSSDAEHRPSPDRSPARQTDPYRSGHPRCRA